MVYCVLIWKVYGIIWGDFYLVKDSDWRDNFPNTIFVAEEVNDFDNTVQREEIKKCGLE